MTGSVRADDGRNIGITASETGLQSLTDHIGQLKQSSSFCWTLS